MEACRGLGFSFGYNRVQGPKEVIAPDKLIALLVDIVSKNGNLLLNIGPRSDDSISEIQLGRLQVLGCWLDAGRASSIRDPGFAFRHSVEGVDVRFTKKADSLYAFLLRKPDSARLTIP